MNLGQKLSMTGACLVMGTVIVIFLLVNDRLSEREWVRIASDLLVSAENFERVLDSREEQLVKQAWTFFQDPLRISELENYRSPYSFYQVIAPYLQDIGFHSEHRFAAVFHEIFPEGAEEPLLNLAYPPQPKGDMPTYFSPLRKFLTRQDVLEKLPLEQGLLQGELLRGKTLVVDHRFFRMHVLPIGSADQPLGVLLLFHEITDNFARAFSLQEGQAGGFSEELVALQAEVGEQGNPEVVFLSEDLPLVATHEDLVTFPDLGQYFQQQRQVLGASPVGEISLGSERYLCLWRVWNQDFGAGYMLMKSYDDALAPLRRLQYSMLLWGGVVMLVGIAITLLITRSLVGPIKQLVQATHAVEAGDLEFTLAIQSHDEISTLTRSFNHMVTQVREKERMEAMLAQKEIERHRSVAEMVTGVAHELNTPLGIATYAANIISTSLDEEAVAAIGTDEDSRETLGDVVDASRLIQSNIARASTLIQRFKTVSVEQLSDALEEVDIVEKMEEIISLCRIGSQLKIDLQVELSPAQRRWCGYPGYLFQVVQNLLANIDRYAYKEGDQARALVLLSIAEIPKDQQKAYFKVIVKDYGQGIPEQDLARVFDAFYTTGRAKGGSGLGLAIVNNLVCSAMAGTIEVFSEVGQGTEFHITIPQTMTEDERSEENQ